MSVMIRSMQMPEKCLWCPLQYIGFCQVTKTDVNSALDRRADDCPLIELPEKHGALIDKESILKDFELAQKSAVIYGRECANAFYSSGNEISTEWWAVEDLVKNAVAVIEAEGEW